MYPTREEAIALLAEAEPHNPGPWGDHSRTAAHCAEKIAAAVGLDPDKAFVLGLLHDIGRHLQYTQNIPHDEAGAQLAEIIMADCGFSPAERAEIMQAILQHRGDGDRSRDGLAALLYRADKASRACLFCTAEPECNWSREKKNMTLQA